MSRRSKSRVRRRSKSRVKRRSKSRLRGGLTAVKTSQYAKAYRKGFNQDPNADPPQFKAFVAAGETKKTKQAAALAVTKLPLAGGRRKSMRKSKRRKSMRKSKRRKSMRKSKRRKSMRKSKRRKSMRRSKRRKSMRRSKRRKSMRRSKRRKSRMRGGVSTDRQIRDAYAARTGKTMTNSQLTMYKANRKAKLVAQQDSSIARVHSLQKKIQRQTAKNDAMFAQRQKDGSLSRDQIDRINAIKRKSVKPSCKDDGSCSACSIM